MLIAYETALREVQSIYEESHRMTRYGIAPRFSRSAKVLHTEPSADADREYQASDAHNHAAGHRPLVLAEYPAVVRICVLSLQP